MQVQMNIPKIKDRLEDSLLVAHVAQQANHLKTALLLQAQAHGRSSLATKFT
jgi:hypothetical protein